MNHSTHIYNQKLGRVRTHTQKKRLPVTYISAVFLSYFFLNTYSKQRKKLNNTLLVFTIHDFMGCFFSISFT